MPMAGSTLPCQPWNPEKPTTMELSYIGMEKKVVRYRGSNTMRIAMVTATSNELDEVEVVETGYGRLPRKDMVGAFTTVKAEDVMILPIRPSTRCCRARLPD